jgi:hypothetical protein
MRRTLADPEPARRGVLDRREDTYATPGDTTAPDAGWAAEAPRHRATWERHSATPWDEVEPYHRFAHDLRSEPTYRDRSWDQVQPELRQEWEWRHPDRPWEGAAGALRELWEGAAGLVRRAGE